MITSTNSLSLHLCMPTAVKEGYLCYMHNVYMGAYTKMICISSRMRLCLLLFPSSSMLHRGAGLYFPSLFFPDFASSSSSPNSPISSPQLNATTRKASLQQFVTWSHLIRWRQVARLRQSTRPECTPWALGWRLQPHHLYCQQHKMQQEWTEQHNMVKTSWITAWVCLLITVAFLW